jgi:hypothetical protein
VVVGREIYATRAQRDAGRGLIASCHSEPASSFLFFERPAGCLRVLWRTPSASPSNGRLAAVARSAMARTVRAPFVRSFIANKKDEFRSQAVHLSSAGDGAEGAAMMRGDFLWLLSLFAQRK